MWYQSVVPGPAAGAPHRPLGAPDRRHRHDQDRRPRQVAAGDGNAVLAHAGRDLGGVLEPRREPERRQERHRPRPHRRQVREVGRGRSVPHVAGAHAGQVEMNPLHQDVGRGDRAVVEDRAVVTDPERDPAGRRPDGSRDRRDQRILW